MDAQLGVLVPFIRQCLHRVTDMICQAVADRNWGHCQDSKLQVFGQTARSRALRRWADWVSLARVLASPRSLEGCARKDFRGGVCYWKMFSDVKFVPS